MNQPLLLGASVAILFQTLHAANPTDFNWPDRRPIGALFLASSGQNWPKNPRGYFNDPNLDIQSPEGREELRLSQQLLKRPQSHSWKGDRFVAPRSGDHAVADGDSLIPVMPLLLAHRLLPGQQEVLVRHLKRFVTAYGLATEHPDSPLYQPDGYWRGPVWAPTTLLMVEALLACGEGRLAADIARRFCEACRKGGLAENFDALTGEGLRDRAYSWTASVFLVLAPLAGPPSRPRTR